MTRAVLKNGLRVVVIRNPLAPVVTVEENYLAGGDETPDGFPGTAHAQEHMAFRGCAGISGDQTAALYAQLGGLNNADTQQNITQYFATVPAADLDIALRMDSACMRRSRMRTPSGRRREALSSRKWPAISPIRRISSSLG